MSERGDFGLEVYSQGHNIFWGDFDRALALQVFWCVEGDAAEVYHLDAGDVVDKAEVQGDPLIFFKSSPNFRLILVKIFAQF